MVDFIGGNQIALGTKQDLLVSIVDLAAQVTDLSVLSPKYTVWDDAGNAAYTDQAASAVEMVVYCLIDTTVDPAGPFTWAAGMHCRLWTKFTVGSEIPYIGPFDFYII